MLDVCTIISGGMHPMYMYRTSSCIIIPKSIEDHLELSLGGGHLQINNALSGNFCQITVIEQRIDCMSELTKPSIF